MKRLDGKLVDILLVEDNPGDVLLTREAFNKSRMRNEIHVARDGHEAMDFLHRRGDFADAPRPDLILLDLNLPGIRGTEVLEQIKQDDNLKSIPVIVLTSSSAERDLVESYQLHANGYVIKPVDWQQFSAVVAGIEGFWFEVVVYPS